MVEFDVSSNVLHLLGDKGNLGQVGATFYGPLLCRVTATPLWIYRDGTLVTIIYQDRCCNASWGGPWDDSPVVKARKKTDVTYHQPVTTRQKTR